MILIFMFVIIFVIIISAVCRVGQQRRDRYAANDYLHREMIRQHQQASQVTAQQLAYADQNAVRMTSADIHRIQTQQAQMYQQIADSHHQNNNGLYGQVQNQQELQLIADHVDAGDRFQKEMFQEHYERIADCMNVGNDGFGMF